MAFYTQVGIAHHSSPSEPNRLATERMRINSSGNLLVGKSTDDGINKLQVQGSVSATSIKSELTPKGDAPTVNGNMTFTAVSDTELRVSLKGSDGEVRSVTLTLA